MRKMIPKALLLGDNDGPILKMKSNYATALYTDPGATLEDLREAVSIFEEIEPTARRVLGSAHPFTLSIGPELRVSRKLLRARETASPR